MSDRFFLPGDWSTGLPPLADEEFHHLTRVLRKQPGDEIEVFDGRGRRQTARIEKLSRQQAHLLPTGPVHESPLSTGKLVIATAPPKGDRFKWLVEKCTELGVDQLIPLRTTRSVVDPGLSKLSKLDQTVIAACKQCRRDWLMQVHPPTDLFTLLLTLQNSQMLVGDSTGHDLGKWIRNQQDAGDSLRNQTDITMFIGPEGGFAPEELARLEQAGGHRVALGQHVLRIETAAIALAAAVRTLF